MKLLLATVEDTLLLGQVFAIALPPTSPQQTVMLDGELGAGKTTFVRGLVKALPGGDEAEVSSPSFNLVNLYPTQPATAHFDLYRLEGLGLDDDLLERLESGSYLSLVEWACHLPNGLWPENHLTMQFRVENKGRSVAIQARGDDAAMYLENVRTRIRDLLQTETA